MGDPPVIGLHCHLSFAHATLHPDIPLLQAPSALLQHNTLRRGWITRRSASPPQGTSQFTPISTISVCTRFYRFSGLDEQWDCRSRLIAVYAITTVTTTLILHRDRHLGCRDMRSPQNSLYVPSYASVLGRHSRLGHQCYRSPATAPVIRNQCNAVSRGGSVPGQ